MTITNNDPKLTAFVLGELTESEAQEIQAAIDADGELRAEVEAIRQTVAQIETAMQNEPLPDRVKISTPGEVDKPETKKSFRFTLTHLLIIISIVGLTAGLLMPGIELAYKPSPDAVNIVHKIQSLNRHSETSELNAVSTGTINPEVPVSTPTLPAPVEKAAQEPEVQRSETSGLAELAEKQREQEYTNALRGKEVNTGGISSGTDYNMFGRPGQVAQMGKPLIDLTSDIMPQSPAPAKGAAPTPDRRAARIAGEGRIITMMVTPRIIEQEQEAEHLRKRDDTFNSANDEAYKNVAENEFKPVKVGEFSTFSIDVDTASYTTMRRFVNEMRKRPPVDSVRLEEYINYFKYDYAPPTDGKPFATHVDVSTCPWEPKHLLARIGIKGKEYSVDERPPLNLVFLIDVSGSMSSSNRLPLVKRGLTELVEMLQTKDRVAIVTYAGESRVALPSISGQEKRAILDSINSLGAGGSTAGAAGIKTAYEVARKYYDKQAQNRVILCTDGDFNVGETNNKTLEEMIGDEAKSGVFLTILGFGMGNYKDDRLKTLSMRGNGNYGYIDNIEEARRLLVEGLTGTLFAIAKDVKIQVDFNPAKVAGYRLLGYENRKLRNEDFHNDKVDAGEIGAGHTVTALYEIVPVGENVPTAVDKSRYDSNKETGVITPVSSSNELMFVKLRYKLPDTDKSSLLEYPVTATPSEMLVDSKFAAAVALYGLLLRNSQHSGNGTFDSVLELATPNTKDDKHRKEFVELVKKAKEL